MKKVIVIVLVIAALGIAAFFIKNNFVKKVALTTEEDVCLYLASKSPYNCANHKCWAGTDSNSLEWNIHYQCPGPKEFPTGQGYLLKINKFTGNIKVEGLTN